MTDTQTASKCPFHQTAAAAKTVHNWWPNRIDLKILRQNSPKSDPMGKEFNYAAEFKSLDYAALKARLPAHVEPGYDGMVIEAG